MKTNDVHKVIYRRDDNGLWFAKAPEIRGAHSHGRTLATARRNIREAIALVLDSDDDRSFGLEEEFHLDERKVQAAIKKARALRNRAAEIDSAAQIATEDALLAALNANAGLSLRDLGELLGLSFQRVQQLATKLKHTV